MNKGFLRRKFRSSGAEFKGTGFSNLASAQGSRLLDSNGKFQVKRTGSPFRFSFSFAHELISMSWGKFLAIILGFYVLVNLLFACLYYLAGMENFLGGIARTESEKFFEAFFFSAQTITTVGYGRVNPAGFLPNIIASVEALMGLMSFSIITGLLYGRFAKPEAKIVFAPKILISPFQGEKALMIRFANARNNDLAELEAQVILSLVVLEEERNIRKYYTLKLERSQVTAMPLTWTLVHPIKDESPFLSIDQEGLEELEAEVLVTIKGHDTIFSQTVFSRTSFLPSAFVWNARFKPCFRKSEDGLETILEMDKLGDYELLA